MNWLIAYLATGLTFGLLDALWLRWAGPNLYRPVLGELLAPSFRLAPALIFYLLYIGGIVWFVVRPEFPSAVTPDMLKLANYVPKAIMNGALLGGLCYATYDLTNQATLKTWSWHVTLIDIAWGAAATALASGAGAFAVIQYLQMKA